MDETTVIILMETEKFFCTFTVSELLSLGTPIRKGTMGHCALPSKGKSMYLALVGQRWILAQVGGIFRLRHHEMRDIRTRNGAYLHAFHQLVQHAIAARHCSIG